MPYPATQNPSTDIRTRTFLPELIRGLVVTARHFLRNLFAERDPNPAVLERRGPNQVTTIQYPEERARYPEGYRGLHRLVPREDGKPRCVACYMCATVCPAQCIYIEAGEYEPNDDTTASRVIEKYPTGFVIDELRCIVCGFCVEACPKDAIRMDRSAYLFDEPQRAAGKGGPSYEHGWGHAPPGYTRQGFVYDAAKLLGGPAASHPSDPWTKRQDSWAPSHVLKEAHTRIFGEERKRTELDTKKPVPVVRFFKQ